MNSNNAILLQAYGRIYVQYTFLSSFSLRDSGFRDEILIYCDPRYIDELLKFDKDYKLDLNIKPFNINSYTRTYGPSYRYLYDVDYWSGKNIYIADTDTYFCIDRNIFQSLNQHSSTIGMPLSCMTREIETFNNRSIRMILSNLKHGGLLTAYKLARYAKMQSLYRSTMGYVYLKSELTSSKEFISVCKKYLEILETKPKFLHHVRLFYDESFFYDLLSELNLYPPIVHKNMMEKLKYQIEYIPNSIYYRPMWGIHMHSLRPKKFLGNYKKPTQDLLKDSVFCSYVKKFVNDMNSPKTSKLINYFDDDFKNYIIKLKQEFEDLLENA